MLETEAGPRIRARAAVFATNAPVNDKVELHTKQTPMRTYAIAGRAADSRLASGRLDDCASRPSRSRSAPGDAPVAA